MTRKTGQSGVTRKSTPSGVTRKTGQSGVTRKTGHGVPEIYGWLPVPVIDPTIRTNPYTPSGVTQSRNIPDHSVQPIFNGTRGRGYSTTSIDFFLLLHLLSIYHSMIASEIREALK